MRTTTKQQAPKRKAWAAWSNGDDRTRVQINEPALARAFAKLRGVVRTGYAVLGAYAQIYVTEHSLTWVQAWLKEETMKLTVTKIATVQQRESGDLMAA
jgi:hypothetical protein